MAANHCLSGSWVFASESLEVARSPQAHDDVSPFELYPLRLQNTARIDIRQVSREKEEIFISYVQTSGSELFCVTSLEETNGTRRSGSGDYVTCALFVNAQFQKFCQLTMGPETGCRLLEDFTMVSRDSLEVVCVIKSQKKGFSAKLTRQFLRVTTSALEKPIIFTGAIRVLNWRETETHCCETLNTLQLQALAGVGEKEESTRFIVQVTFKEVAWNVSFLYSTFCVVRDLVLRDLSFVMGEHTDNAQMYASQLSIPYIAANSALMWNDSAVDNRTSAINSFLTSICARGDLHDSSNAVNILSAFLQIPHHWNLVPKLTTVFDSMLSLSSTQSRNSVAGCYAHVLRRDSFSAENVVFFITVKNARVRKHAVFPCVSLVKMMPHVEYEICLTRSDTRSRRANALLSAYAQDHSSFSAMPSVQEEEVEGAAGEFKGEDEAGQGLKATVSRKTNRPDIRSSVFRRFKELSAWLYETQQYLNTIHSPDEVEEKLGLSELGPVKPSKHRSFVDSVTIFPSSDKLDLNGSHVRQRMLAIEGVINSMLEHYPEVLDCVPTLEFLGIGEFVDRIDAIDAGRMHYPDFM